MSTIRSRRTPERTWARREGGMPGPREAAVNLMAIGAHGLMGIVLPVALVVMRILDLALLVLEGIEIGGLDGHLLQGSVAGRILARCGID